MSLASFGVRKPVPIRLLMWGIIIGGIWTAFTIRREFFPETTPERASISLPYPGATPTEIEESMARKVEDAVVELKQVEKVTTTISEGFGSMMVEFKDGEDIRKAIDDVENAIDRLQDLPDDAEEIKVTEIEPNIPAIMVSLYGDAGEDALKSSMRRIIDDLRAMPGMGTIVPGGIRDYEIRVDVDAAALLEHGLSLSQVTATIGQWTSDLPGGSLRTAVGSTSVRTLGVSERAEAIRGIVLKASTNGQIVRVGDVANVSESFTDDQFYLRFNGAPAVNLTVFKTGEQDAIRIAELVRAYVAGRQGKPYPGNEISKSFKPAVHEAWLSGSKHPDPLPGELAIHSDLTRVIEGRLKLLTDNAVQGAALIFLTILFFMNLHMARLVVMGLVTAIFGTLILMSLFGITLNLLTMFGLLITLGMLEDDAIVVSENINARYARGEPPMAAAIKGAEQVFWPVMSTVLTTIVAFVPLSMVKGSIGELLASLPWVVLCSLAVSVLETMVMMPSHMAHALEKQERKPGFITRSLQRWERWRDRRIIEPVTRFYGRFVLLSTQYRYISTSIAIATMIICVALVATDRLKLVFLQETDAETVIVDLRMPIGTSLEQTALAVRRLEQAATAQPEVVCISSVVGQRTDIETNAVDAAATHLAQLFVEMQEVSTRQAEGGRESQQVIAAIRDAAGPLGDVEELRFSEISGGPGGRDISIEVKGANRDSVDLAVEELKQVLAGLKGVADISDDDYSSQKELQIQLKPAAAALGISVADVAREVRGTLHGLEAHTFSANREDIDIRVRLDEASRRSMKSIEDLWIIADGPEGVRRVPLQEIADLSDGSAFATIRRVNRERTVTVAADTTPGVSPEFIMKGVKPHVDRLAAANPDLAFEYAGRQEDLRKAFSTLPVAFGAACLMIYVIVAWLFSSYVQPLIVMIAIPFGIVGVVGGHLLLGYDLTFLSMIGFVALSGVVVNNALILIEFFNDKRRRGIPLREALAEAGQERLRAIVLTSITTFFGLMPLVLETSFQAKFLIPMAIAVSFGLLSSTVLTLLVLPCIIVIFDDVHRLVHLLWHGRARESHAPPGALPDAAGD